MLTDETCRKRINSVDALATEATPDIALALVRLYIKKSVPDHQLQAVRSAFLKDDPLFKMHGNDYELQILAGATLIQMWDVDQNDSALLAALALNCNRQRLTTEPPIPLIAEILQKYLVKKALAARSRRHLDLSFAPYFDNVAELIALRDETPSDDEEDAEDPSSALLDEMVSLTVNHAEALRQIPHVLAVLQEEADILWWVFGERLRDDTDDITPKRISASLFSGIELAGLIQIYPPPVSSEGILRRFNKAFGIRVDAKHDFADSINDCPREKREAWFGKIKEAKSLDLCPIMNSISISLTTDGVNDWLPACKRSLGYQMPKMSLQDLSESVFREWVFLRAAKYVDEASS